MVQVPIQCCGAGPFLAGSGVLKSLRYLPVLWIRIRMDPDLLPGSGSGIIVRIRIQLNMKEQISLGL